MGQFADEMITLLALGNQLLDYLTKGHTSEGSGELLAQQATLPAVSPHQLGPPATISTHPPGR